MTDGARSERRSAGIDLRLRIAVLWAVMVPLALLILTQRGGATPATLTVMPEVARPGDPVIATYKLNNPTGADQVRDFWIYEGGRVLAEGTSVVPANSSKNYQYIRPHTLALGERVTFGIESRGDGGAHGDSVSVPPYPPQILSSFVSFAAFSTTVMSSMTSMSYYGETFAPASAVNVGLVMTMVLLALLVFLEVTQPLLPRGAAVALVMLRARFGRLSTVLFIIFVGIVFTRAAMVLSG